MNRRIKTLLCLYILCSQFFIIAQTEATSYDLEQFVYWFHIKADIKPQKVTSKPIYVVRLGEDEPRHGTVYDYEYDLWKQIQMGNDILIGPFLDYYDAKNAMEMYKLQNQLTEKQENELSVIKEAQLKGQYYWYFLTFKIKKRKGSFSLKRIPAAVASGELAQFKQVLAEGLTWQKLAIGPFPSQTEAEESKRLNRLEEEEE